MASAFFGGALAGAAVFTSEDATVFLTSTGFVGATTGLASVDLVLTSVTLISTCFVAAIGDDTGEVIGFAAKARDSARVGVGVFAEVDGLAGTWSAGLVTTLFFSGFAEEALPSFVVLELIVGKASEISSTPKLRNRQNVYQNHSFPKH